MAKKKKGNVGPSKAWLDTYADMITLCLCFFIIMFNPEEVTESMLAPLVSYFYNMGPGARSGGNTYSEGSSADLGNTIISLPSMDKGRALADALRKAVSLFNPEVRSNKVKVTTDERGLIISLASDAFFNPASARVNIEETRDILMRLASLLSSEEVEGRKFRIEGHTDNEIVDPAGPWADNWELSTARSIAVLHYLTDLGVDEKRFQVAGFADTMPVSDNSTPEGRAYNRRVDIVILDEGHL